MVEKTETASACVRLLMNHKEWFTYSRQIHRAIEGLCVPGVGKTKTRG